MNEQKIDAELGDKRAGKQRRGAMISVRLSQAELDDVQAKAERQGTTVSAYLRALAVGTAGHVSSAQPSYIQLSRPTSVATSNFNMTVSARPA